MQTPWSAAVLAAASVALVAAPARPQCEFDELVPSDPSADKLFGSGVARDGTHAAVGAPGDGSLGAVYVFEEDVDTALGQLQKLTDPMGSADDLYGWSVALSGDRLVVGAPGNDDSASDGGKVFVYEYAAMTWSLDQAIASPSAAASAGFGSAVAIDGDSLVVGAPGEAKAYVYGRGGSWSLDDTLAGSSDFGAAVAISEASARVAVGEPGSGAAEVFVLSGTWQSEQVLAPGSASDETGAAVAIHRDPVDGDTLVVGAPGDDTSGTDAGAAWVFTRTLAGSTWTLDEQLLPIDGDDDDEFGRAVDVEEDLILVGAPEARNFVYGLASGAADVFALDAGSGTWTPVYRLTSYESDAGHRYGESVGLDGGLGASRISAVVGSPRHLHLLADEGAAYDHRLDGDCDGDLVPDIAEIAADAAENANGNCLLDDCEVEPSFLTVAFGHGGGADPYVVSVASTVDDGTDDDVVDGTSDENPNQGAATTAGDHTVGSPGASAGGGGDGSGGGGDASGAGSGGNAGHGAGGGASGSGGGASQTPSHGDDTPSVLREDLSPRFVDLTEQVVPGGDAHPFDELSEYFDGFFTPPQLLAYDEVPGERGVPNRGAWTETLMLHDEVTVQGVVAAELSILITASDNPRTHPGNDVIALEVVDPGLGLFGWESPIADLPEAGGVWEHGQSAVFTLDLTSLPLPGGAEVDLLPGLADGRLDVVVHGNSGVGWVAMEVGFFDPIREYTVRYAAGTALATVLAALPKGSTVHYTNDPLGMVYGSFRNSNVGDLDAEIWLEGAELTPPALSSDVVVQGPRCFGTTLVEARQILGFDDLPPALRTAAEEVAMLDAQFPTHLDFCGRVTRVDDNYVINPHPTAVAGTMAADGSAKPGVSEGMLPNATVYAYTRLNQFNVDKLMAGHTKELWDIPAKPAVEQMLDALSRGAFAVNNSWGYKENLGSYVAQAPDIDAMVRANAVTACFAAGNCQQGPTLNCPPGGGYGRILSTSTAKNVITIGGLCGTSDALPLSASWGPTLDGRLKPDVVSLSVRAKKDLHHSAQGAWELVAESDVLCKARFHQKIGSATSWGTPLATSCAAALAWYLDDQLLLPDPALIKAVMCNTATDVAGIAVGVNTGPDYKTGYGLFHAERAYDALVAGDYVLETTGVTGTAPGDAHTYQVVFDGSGRLTSVTRVSTPPPPCPPVGVTASGGEGPEVGLRERVGGDRRRGGGLGNGGRLGDDVWLGRRGAAGEGARPPRDGRAEAGDRLAPGPRAPGAAADERPTRIRPVSSIAESPTSRVKFMLVWSDPKCTQGCDDTDPMMGGALVSDLDLRLTDPTANAYHAYALDPFDPDRPAVRTEPNRRDNVEQIAVTEAEILATGSGCWYLTVDAASLPEGAQGYALTWFDEGGPGR